MVGVGEVAGGVGERGGSAGEEVVDGAAAVAGGPSAVGFPEGVVGGGDAGGCEAGGEPASAVLRWGYWMLRSAPTRTGPLTRRLATTVVSRSRNVVEEAVAAGAAG